MTKLRFEFPQQGFSSFATTKPVISLTKFKLERTHYFFSFISDYLASQQDRVKKPHSSVSQIKGNQIKDDLVNIYA